MSKKIQIGILIIIFSLLIFAVPVFADPPGASKMQGISNASQGNSQLISAGNDIIGVVYVFGIVVSIATLSIIGIKYMLSSAEGRASLKERAVPYLIGAVLTFAAVNILRIIATLTEWIK